LFVKINDGKSLEIKYNKTGNELKYALLGIYEIEGVYKEEKYIDIEKDETSSSEAILFSYPSAGVFEARLHLDDGTYLCRSSKIEVDIGRIPSNPLANLNDEQIEALEKFQKKFSDLKGEDKDVKYYLKVVL
jgi:hypothetical protein